MPDSFTPIHTQRKKRQLKAASGRPDPDPLILVAVARALYWEALLDSGAYGRVRDIADAEGLKPTTVGRILRLARLAPEILEELNQGRQPSRLTLYWFMRHDIPTRWVTQRQAIERFR